MYRVIDLPFLRFVYSDSERAYGRDCKHGFLFYTDVCCYGRIESVGNADIHKGLEMGMGESEKEDI
jgi:hypothetical protein